MTDLPYDGLESCPQWTNPIYNPNPIYMKTTITLKCGASWQIVACLQ